MNIFLLGLCSAGEPVNVHEHIRTFVDQIFLQALSVVCPVQRQNFGLSMAADHRRFRDHKGQVSAKGASMPSTCCNEFLPFKGFFFDTWAAGIKEPLQTRRLEDCLRDVDWSLVDYSHAFVDIACEKVPSAPVVGIPCKDSLPTMMMEAVFYEYTLSACSLFHPPPLDLLLPVAIVTASHVAPTCLV